MFKFFRMCVVFLWGVMAVSWMGCVVKEKPSIDALACTKKGECTPPYKCFDVPQQGALCLANGAGLEPYSGTAETVPDSSAQQEASSESLLEGGADTPPEHDTSDAGESLVESNPEGHTEGTGESAMEATSPEEETQETIVED